MANEAMWVYKKWSKQRSIRRDLLERFRITLLEKKLELKK
jgi:hypothetical protein